MMHWLKNNMLHLVPLVIFKKVYREHDMLANGLLIGAEMDMELSSKHWMAWLKHGQFLATEFFSQHLIFQYLMLCFIIHFETFSAN